MPTGYTAGIEEGTEESLKTFILKCARAFGYCMDQRDDNLDVPPTMQKVGDYHKKGLKEAKKDIDDFNKLDQSQLELMYNEAVEDIKNTNKENRESRKAIKQRYNEYLSGVKNWMPPTKDHEGLKKFMLEQINDSMKWDCRESDDEKIPTFNEWLDVKKNNLEWHMEYNAKQLKKEEEQVAAGNKWKQELFDSLKEM